MALPAEPTRRAQPPLVEIFTDGACSGNPGPGGWAAILRYRPPAGQPSGSASTDRREGSPRAKAHPCPVETPPGGGSAAARGDPDRVEKELSGFEPLTTNNRMELTAAIEALEALKRPCRVRLVSDSQYLRDGITRWIGAWKARGWRTAAKEPVKNVDLWQRLERAMAPHKVEWQWVRGHAGHPENERADALARAQVALARRAGAS